MCTIDLEIFVAAINYKNILQQKFLDLRYMYVCT